MKKTLLALAVSSLATSVFAADIDYRVTNPGVNTIASELNLPTNGQVVTTDDLTWNLGFSVTAATQRYVRVSLTNGATFTATPTLQADTAGTPTAGVYSQGGIGQSYVIFEVTPTSNFTPTTDVVLTLNGITLTGKTDVGVSYQLFETAVDAVNNTDALVTAAAAPYITYGAGLSALFQPASTRRIIDVSATPTSTAFVATGGVATASVAVIGGFAVDAVANRLDYDFTGPSVTLADLVAAGTNLQIDGDFSAGLKTAGVVNTNAVQLSTAATPLVPATPATTVTASRATFTLDTNALGTVGTTPVYVPVVYSVDGTSAIQPSVYSGVYNVVPATGTTTASVSADRIGELAKNGASQYVDLALNPNGAFENYVRISNKTGVEGNVYITVFADNGQSVTIDLGDVEGQSTVLGARSSTTQMTVKQIFTAAEAAGLILSGERKLRLLVDGEFPTQGNTTNANDYGLSVQTYTVATDGTTFSTF